MTDSATQILRNIELLFKREGLPVIESGQSKDSLVSIVSLLNNIAELTSNNSTVTTTPVVQSTSELTVFRSTSQNSTKAAVKASACKVYGWNIINPNTYAVYLKMYNIAVGGVTVGTSAVSKTLMIPAAGSVFLENNSIIQHNFSTALTIAITKLVADSDATVLDSNVIVEISYV
jgi:hypothetical protein